MGILVVRDGKYLLGKRRGKHMPGFYAAPGGHLEAGETFAECARREVAEETGLTVTTVALLTVGNYLFAEKHYVDIDVIAETEGEPVVMEPDKCENWAWYAREDLPSPLFIVTARMIEAHESGLIVPANVIDALDRA